MEEVRENVGSVVWQDKGNESPRVGERVFSRSILPFSAGYRDSSDVAVTRALRLVMTRARGFLSLLSAALAGAALLILAGHFFQLRITWTDSSAPAGVYSLMAGPGGRGALVAACLPAAIARTGLARGYLREGDCSAGAEPIAKVIGAVAGDVVEVEPAWVAINGVKFTNSRTAARDSADRPLSHVPWGRRRVGAGETWLLGFNDARSWDARYFGPVPIAGVRGVLRPVVTW